jgi:tRNA (guanine37-N1)-methyltransferase
MDQAVLRDLSRFRRFILVAGHYEGIDERIIDHEADFELSMGSYVVTGGEYACLVFVDGITRLLKGVLHNEASHQDESFENGLLEYDQYTRPEVFKNRRVPEVLLSGDHAKIRAWRKESSDRNTMTNRPDLLRKGDKP